MSQLDMALDRLAKAVERLAEGGAGGSAAAAVAGADDKELAEARMRIADLTAELEALRNVNAEAEALRKENAELKSQHEEDTRLRAEAAQAVKVALRDLRDLVPVANGGGAANA